MREERGGHVNEDAVGSYKYHALKFRTDQPGPPLLSNTIHEPPAAANAGD